MKFSKTQGGFYPSNEDELKVYKNLPEDLVEISEEDYEKFKNGGFGESVILEGSRLVANPINATIDYCIEARALRNSLRDKIDKYLLPSATREDMLITEEQKNILIQDSLTLAKWPSTKNWPYVDLPTLSELCTSLITIPEWSYPTQTTE